MGKLLVSKKAKQKPKNKKKEIQENINILLSKYVWGVGAGKTLRNMYFIFIKKLKSKAGEILFPNRQLAQEEDGEREIYIYIMVGGLRWNCFQKNEIHRNKKDSSMSP